jgi:hypothetical protein
MRKEKVSLILLTKNSNLILYVELLHNETK